MKQRMGTNKPGSLFWIGLALVGGLLLLAVVSNFWTPYSTTAMSAVNKFRSPGSSHWMGTDNFGRDIFSRVMEGLRTTFVIAGLTVVMGTTIGMAVGILTGYYGGWLDEVLMRLNDAVASFPSILLALVVISVWGSGKYHIILALGIVFIPSFARITRSEFIRYRNREFVDAALSMGIPDYKIIFRHILPNAMPTIFSAMIIGINNAVLAESSLSFLGLGVQPPDASLGKMLSEAQGYIMSAPWYTLGPALIMVVLMIGIVLLNEGLK